MTEFQKGPKHVALVMDGNGRWAQSRGLPRLKGHHSGVQAIKKTIEAALEFNIPYITFWAFSAENWRRPKGEVLGLMGLIRYYFDKELAHIHKQGIRLSVMGQKGKFPQDIQDYIVSAETLTKNNSKLNVTIALSYGGRQDLLQSIQKISHHVKNGNLTPEDITQETVEKNLWTSGIPDPDLMIRTGGERRLSNYMLWQLSYTELYFSDVLWPDFEKQHLQMALQDFALRERRFGGISGK